MKYEISQAKEEFRPITITLVFETREEAEKFKDGLESTKNFKGKVYDELFDELEHEYNI